MRERGGRMLGGVVMLACLGSLLAPLAAEAKETVVRSFDGTPIVVNFFTAEGVSGSERAPTILIGPGFSSAGQDDAESGMVGSLRKVGYNVVTWDPRGFGGSGGEANIDSPTHEARDVSAIISWLARQPNAQLERAGDPLVGMSGSSYGGGIQFVTAATDGRVDAIAPDIAWNSLLTALFKAGDLKAGWGAVLCGTGIAQGLATGLISPAGLQTGSVAAPVMRTCVGGTATGSVPAADKAWFKARGPRHLLDRIRVPTLITQGTVDTLFPLSEGIANFNAIGRNGVPLRMMWFCGGHGVCRTGEGPEKHKERRVIAWFDRHLKRKPVSVGPRFEWLADDARWRSAGGWPLRRKGALRGSGSGTVPMTAVQNSGALILASPVIPGGFDVPIEPAKRTSEILGAPKLRLSYSATGAPSPAHVYAQVVDEQRNLVVDHQITPIRLALDGRPHTVDVALEPIAVHATAGDRYRLEIAPSTTLYYPQNSVGLLNVRRAQVELPIVDPTAPPRGTAIRGTPGDDVLVGTPGDDVIDCGAGNDRVRAGGGNDIVRCGAGNDIISGGPGNDRLAGGSGRDRVRGDSGRDRLFGNSGRDRLRGGSGRDRARGGTGNDRIAGGSAGDRLAGNSGRDRIEGNAGRDSLFGGSGRDRLRGGPGRDRLFGGSGRDRLNGGPGRDRVSQR